MAVTLRGAAVGRGRCLLVKKEFHIVGLEFWGGGGLEFSVNGGLRSSL